MIFSQLILLLGLTAAWYLDTFESESSMTIVGIVVVILGYQFGLGSIPWVYMAETCNDRAASVCAIANFLVIVIVVVIAPYLYSAVNGYMWLIYAAIVAFYFVFVCVFVKETKGLSEEEVKKLYRVDNDA